MKFEELIEGEIYFQNTGYKYIFTYQKRENPKLIGYGNYLDLECKSYQMDDGRCQNGEGYSTIRIPTPQEKAQLLKSIELGRYVPLEEIVLEDNYSVFN